MFAWPVIYSGTVDCQLKVHYLTKTVQMSSAYTLVYSLSTYNPLIVASTLQQAQGDVHALGVHCEDIFEI